MDNSTKLTLNRKKVVIANLNIDGIMSVAIIKKIFGKDNVTIYYSKGYSNNAKDVTTILSLYKGIAVIEDLLLINLKLSVSNIITINKFFNSGVRVFSYSYLFEPTSLEGLKAHIPGMITGNIIRKQLLDDHKELLDKIFKESSNLLMWSETAVKYENGDKNISYIENLGSLIMDVTYGVNSVLYANLVDRMVDATLEIFIDTTTSSNIYYYGRLLLSRKLVGVLNIHPDSIHLTIPEMIIESLKKGNFIFRKKNQLTYCILAYSPNVNIQSKGFLSMVDVVINLGKNGLVQVRCNKPHNALSIEKDIMKDIPGVKDKDLSVPTQSYAFYSGFNYDLDGSYLNPIEKMATDFAKYFKFEE